MVIKNVISEDFVNYKVPSMFIIFPYCTFKCEKDCGQHVCQNSEIIKLPDINIPAPIVITKYLSNNITSAIICGGMEPLDSYEDLIELLTVLREEYKCMDPFIIYTGYTETEFEAKKEWKSISKFHNIIIKFGRFVPNQPHHKDEILGVELASPNQYAKIYK